MLVILAPLEQEYSIEWWVNVYLFLCLTNEQTRRCHVWNGLVIGGKK